MAVYPSDAPLPRFKITRVQGSPNVISQGSWIALKFECEITNYQELKVWWSSRNMGDGEAIRFFGNPNRCDFINGVHSLTDEAYEGVARGETFGTWATFAFLIYEDLSRFNVLYDFVKPLYFCDVYVPFPSDLPVGVWSDLQFKQTQPPSGSGLAIIIVPIALLFLLFLFLGLSGGKKRGRG